MKTTFKYGMCALLLGLSLSGNAWAQTETAAEAQRMDRLERDIMLLQRQLARGEARPFTSADGPAEVFSPAPSAGSADTGVRIMQLEEEMRKLQGQLEESHFKNRQLEEKIERMQKDVEFRLNDLESKPAANAPASEDAPAPKRASKNAPTSLSPAITTQEPEAAAPREEQLNRIIEQSNTEETDHFTSEENVETVTPPPSSTETPPTGPTSAGDGVLKPPQDADSGPREQYNQAFKLLNQTKYDEAANQFRSFIRQYPKDPLIGNAYYWLGETHYISRDYVKAADTFRQGFEALPNGPKAADNLLKLSMSLSAMQKEKEACIVLDQILAKFSKTSAAVSEKAKAERLRLNCK